MERFGNKRGNQAGSCTVVVPRRSRSREQQIIAGLKSEIKRLRRDCAELYQVIGTLDELVPEEDKAATIKALDNASAAADGEPRPHDDLLPFILKSLSRPL
jgi:hypothetical protein